MRANLENPRIYEARLSGLRHSNVVLAMTGTQIIPSDGPTVWVLDGGASARSVRLPVLTSDKQVVLANAGLTNDINVTDSTGAALVTVGPQAMALFFAGTSRWVWIVNNFLAADVINKTVIVASGAVASSDIIVQVNGAGAVVLSLPASATWDTVSGFHGLPLSIMDVSGNASANNITINPNGVETIGGNASLTINANYGSYELRPSTLGGWIYR